MAIKTFVAILALIFAIIKLWPVPSKAPTYSLAGQLFPVARVIDGNTVDVNLNGHVERIRLIGINTPETVDPRKPVQCFGHEASDHAKQILTGQKVALEADPATGDRDKYGRLLRYVWLADNISFNLAQISQGYAHEYTYDSTPYRYQAQYKAAERSAREQNIGLWSPNTCNGKTTFDSLRFDFIS